VDVVRGELAESNIVIQAELPGFHSPRSLTSRILMKRFQQCKYSAKIALSLKFPNVVFGPH
jgi:hypothetical protein